MWTIWSADGMRIAYSVYNAGKICVADLEEANCPGPTEQRFQTSVLEATLRLRLMRFMICLELTLPPVYARIDFANKQIM